MSEDDRLMLVDTVERFVIRCPCGWRGGKTFRSMNGAKRAFDAHVCDDSTEDNV